MNPERSHAGCAVRGGLERVLWDIAEAMCEVQEAANLTYRSASLGEELDTLPV
jgi:hypothetical protein